jgi:hypothetical protein
VLVDGADADAERRGGSGAGAAAGDPRDGGGLPRSQAGAAERVRHRGLAVAPLALEGECVAVALDQDRPCPTQQIAFGVGEVVLTATQDNPEETWGPLGQGEGELVLEAERTVELVVDLEGVEVLRGGDVGESDRPAAPSPGSGPTS